MCVNRISTPVTKYWMRIAEIITSWQNPNKLRPPDIIDFLLSRGGVKDYGGELRAMDLHRVQKGKFGRLARSNGKMTLDYAREAAVEAGYLQPTADINDLLQALFNNTHGHPVYPYNDELEWREQMKAERQKEQETEYWHPDNLFAGI